MSLSCRSVVACPHVPPRGHEFCLPFPLTIAGGRIPLTDRLKLYPNRQQPCERLLSCCRLPFQFPRSFDKVSVLGCGCLALSLPCQILHTYINSRRVFAYKQYFDFQYFCIQTVLRTSFDCTVKIFEGCTKP